MNKLLTLTILALLAVTTAQGEVLSRKTLRDYPPAVTHKTKKPQKIRKTFGYMTQIS